MERRAIVTGASRGLGAALAGQLEERGWQVLRISRSSVVSVDLADPGSLTAWLATPTLREHLAAADEVLLLNNAGTLGPATPSGTQDPAAIINAVNINVAAVLLLTNAVLALRREGVPLRIAHVSSGAGRRPVPGWSVYCATKAAVDQHALTVASEGIPDVRIGSIAPGVVDTAMQAQIRDCEGFPGREDFVALKRNGVLLTPGQSASGLLDIVLADDFGREVLTRVEGAAR